MSCERIKFFFQKYYFYENMTKNNENTILFSSKSVFLLFSKGSVKKKTSVEPNQWNRTLLFPLVSICFLFFFLCASHPQTSTISTTIPTTSSRRHHHRTNNIIARSKQHSHQQIYAPQHHRATEKSRARRKPQRLIRAHRWRCNDGVTAARWWLVQGGDA